MRHVIVGMMVAASLGVTACGGTSSSGFSPSGLGDGGGVGGTTGGSAGQSSGGSGNALNTGGQPGSGGSAGAADGCVTNADCVGDPAGPVCDPASGSCVICLTGSDCPSGQFCDVANHACQAGCDEASDCSGLTPICDPNTNTCVTCALDTDCVNGQICVSNACAQGCSATQPCPGSSTCCSGSCHNLTNDPTACGSCNTACPSFTNAATLCTSGVCSMGGCAVGFANCNQNVLDGCEMNTSVGSCLCSPSSTQSCYTGPSGTAGLGACKAGTQTCDLSGLSWGPCVGQVVPAPEACANGVDENCNGVPDDVSDTDGDGWTQCTGDCCETAAQCSKPNKVNPGAYEVVGNLVDDDCDASTSDAYLPADCATNPKFNGVTGSDVAMAMDICQFTTANPPKPQQKWGVVSAEQLLPNGGVAGGGVLNDMQNLQTAVLNNYGVGGVVPTKGATIAGISSGRMRDANDPGYVAPNSGSTLTSSSQPPAVYLAAHGGVLPSSLGCSGGACPSGNGANDGVNIRLTIRVPTNALSFSYKFRFFSAEYWTYQCTQYNDFYLALLTTGAAGIPPDKNISFDSLGNPVSVNNGFFDICAVKTCNSCPFGTFPLAGTGMEIGNTGGGTAWLTTTAPIVPGELMQIDFMVFDVSDHILDSLTLLDAFEWSLDPSGVGTSG